MDFTNHFTANLLALSMLQHPSGQWAWGRFVIVHPAGNPGFTDAVERYRATTDGTSFGSTTLEALLATNDALDETDRHALGERYLF